jgi:RNA polymerase sigma-54 factor
MGIELKQSMRQSQNLLLSPQIQQAIKILTLGRMELQEYVSEELKENPCLEENEKGFANDSSANVIEIAASFDKQCFGREESSASPGSEFEPSLADLGQALMNAGEVSQNSAIVTSIDALDAEGPVYDRVASKQVSLYEELEKQIRVMHLTEHEVHCALVVMQYIDDEGYLSSELQEIAEENDLNEEDCLYALKAIQRCEPLGVGARDAQECILLQIQGRSEIPSIAERIVREFWSDLQRVDVKKIARGLKVNVEDVKEAITFIRSELDPKPARQFGDGGNHIVEPDVYIFQREGKWVVSLNEEGLPRLKVSKRYEKLVDNMEKGNKDAAQAELKNFVQTKIKSAKWLVRALAERNKTILRVAEVIARRQSEFLDKGVEALRPMTLKTIAEELELHESTISRTTTSKYVQTPRGLFELKYFFNSALENESGEQLANETIKVWVGEMIKNENPAQPLSDQDISDIIASNRNLKVARRTIAKYRESLGIPSSSKRVRKF